jgi:hypothetical protein
MVWQGAGTQIDITFDLRRYYRHSALVDFSHAGCAVFIWLTSPPKPVKIDPNQLYVLYKLFVN